MNKSSGENILILCHFFVVLFFVYKKAIKNLYCHSFLEFIIVFLILTFFTIYSSINSIFLKYKNKKELMVEE